MKKNLSRGEHDDRANRWVIVPRALIGLHVAPTLLDPIEKSLDPVTRAIQIGTEADRLLAIAFRGDSVCALPVDGLGFTLVGRAGFSHRGPEP